MNMDAYWTVWLFFLVPVSFALAEGYALWTGKTTLSRYIWNLNKAFPPFGWLAGGITGFLVCHFWWTCMGCPA
jgi:hypothetical protein